MHHCPAEPTILDTYLHQGEEGTHREGFLSEKNLIDPAKWPPGGWWVLDEGTLHVLVLVE